MVSVTKTVALCLLVGVAFAFPNPFLFKRQFTTAFGGYNDPNPGPEPTRFAGYNDPNPGPEPTRFAGYNDPNPGPEPTRFAGYNDPNPGPEPTRFAGYNNPFGGPEPTRFAGYNDPNPGPEPTRFAGYNDPNPGPEPTRFAGYNDPNPGPEPTRFAGYNDPNPGPEPTRFSGYNERKREHGPEPTRFAGYNDPNPGPEPTRFAGYNDHNHGPEPTRFAGYNNPAGGPEPTRFAGYNNPVGGPGGSSGPMNRPGQMVQALLNLRDLFTAGLQTVDMYLQLAGYHGGNGPNGPGGYGPNGPGGYGPNGPGGYGHNGPGGYGPNGPGGHGPNGPGGYGPNGPGGYGPNGPGGHGPNGPGGAPNLEQFRQQGIQALQSIISSGNMDNYKAGLQAVLKLLQENKLKDAVQKFKGILEDAKANGVTQVGQWSIKDMLDTINPVLSSGYLDSGSGGGGEGPTDYKKKVLEGVQKILASGILDNYKDKLQGILKLLNEDKFLEAIMKLEQVLQDAQQNGIQKLGDTDIGAIIMGLQQLQGLVAGAQP